MPARAGWAARNRTRLTKKKLLRQSMRLLGLALLASCVESQDGIILGRVTLFDQWFRRTEHTRAHTSRHTDGKAGPDAPEAWTVRSKRDVVRGELIYNKAKRVRRGTTVQGNVSVVLKGVGRHDEERGLGGELRDVGVRHLLCQTGFGDMNHEQNLASMRRFGEGVMTAFQ